MNEQYKIIFKHVGITSDRMKGLMNDELLRVYSDEYVDRVNDILPRLNQEFETMYQGKSASIFVDFQDEYMEYIVNGYQTIADSLNEKHVSRLLTFYVGEEANLMGSLIRDPEVTVEFFLKKV